MTFYEVLEQVIELLQRHGRVSYRALRRQFDLDEIYLEDLKAEIIGVQQLAVDQDGIMLIWTGSSGMAPAPASPLPAEERAVLGAPPAEHRAPAAERRQLTVMFCDLVDSTALAGRLDLEDLRQVLRAYQETCADVIRRFEGYIAQYLGDGLLVYFGYPQAHEDSAQRAVYAGLGILEAMRTLQTRLERERGVHLAVRVGIHTGLVVVGEIGAGARKEQLALGETPNVAARLQGLAEPDTVVISGYTARLVQGYFACDDRGMHTLRGIAAPMQVYRVLRESAAQSRLDVAVTTGLTTLVGREEEIGLLLRHWEQSQAGLRQVGMLSGEAGIGKSRLVQALRERIGHEGYRWMAFRCSPYYTHTAFYAVIESLQRFLQWRQDDTAAEKLTKLEQMLRASRVPLQEVVPLFATLLSMPLPEERYPPLNLSPERHKRQTQEALVSWLLQEAERQPVLAVWEDLHWADPSTLELLSLVINQTSTARMLILLTCRPEFHPPRDTDSHPTPITLNRLGSDEVEQMVAHLTRGKPLPPEVLQQVIAKTDGVPLFVEELLKMVLESGLVREEHDHYALTEPLPPLAIPGTLQDSLMARLDRLGPAKEVAQLCSVLGREFTYEVIHAVATMDAQALQYSLAQLVAAELVYQRGILPRSTYIFKHALIQETAYQSLLRSTRQHYHQRIAEVLAAQFSETAETRPELLAHHYTEAGLHAPAIPYWQRAGQRAVERSANLEAISHLTRGLEALTTLPDTPERAQQELTLQLALGSPLFMTRGRTASEVEDAYLRAYELCQQVGDDLQRFSALAGLWRFYAAQARLRTAHERAEQCFVLAQRANDPVLLQAAHQALGSTLFFLGELPAARQHLAQGIALYTPQSSHSMAFSSGTDPGVACLARQSWTLWLLGYPERALATSHEALALARQTTHAYSLSLALSHAAVLHAWRAEVQTVLEYADALIEFASEQGFVRWLGNGMCARGWALVEQGRTPEGIEQLRQGLANRGQNVGQTHFLAMLVEGYWKTGQADTGLHWLAEALATVQRSAEHYYEAELYRLQGELRRRQAVGRDDEAEACFRQAIEVAHHQQAKSLELRAVMSLSRLWQQQGRRTDARHMLAGLYAWFTEGFDTADLQEARALLQALA